MQKVTFQIIPFSFLLLLAPLISNGQTEKTVKNVTGEAYIRGEVSPKEAQKQALQKAKTNALREAGIEEYVSTWQFQLTKQTDGSISQSFSDAINSEIQGTVSDFEKVNTNKYYNEKLEVYVHEVTINATVKKYETETDPNFNIKLDNIQKVYREGDSISFKVKSSKNCYLTVFNIAKSNNLRLYPNEWEDPKQLKAGMRYTFPFGAVYTARLPEDVNKEINTFLFVFTKEEPMGFIHADQEGYISAHEKIFQEIHEIPRKDRKVKVKQFKIFAKE